MTVVAMVGNKGGAVKTTLPANLVCALNAVAPTAILDADPQGSALQWRAIAERTDMPDVFASARQMETVLATRREAYRHLMIDCPPAGPASDRSAGVAHPPLPTGPPGAGRAGPAGRRDRRASVRLLDGKSVINMGSRGRAAAEELQQLISEVITS